MWWWFVCLFRSMYAASKKTSGAAHVCLQWRIPISCVKRVLIIQLLERQSTIPYLWKCFVPSDVEQSDEWQGIQNFFGISWKLMLMTITARQSTSDADVGHKHLTPLTKMKGQYDEQVVQASRVTTAYGSHLMPASANRHNLGPAMKPSLQIWRALFWIRWKRDAAGPVQCFTCILRTFTPPCANR